MYDIFLNYMNKSENTFKYRQLLSCKCLRMRKASRITTQLYDKKLKPLKIKITQFSILSLLASGKYETVNSLSKTLLMDRTTLSRSLDILYKYNKINIYVHI